MTCDEFVIGDRGKSLLLPEQPCYMQQPSCVFLPFVNTPRRLDRSVRGYYKLTDEYVAPRCPPRRGDQGIQGRAADGPIVGLQRLVELGPPRLASFPRALLLKLALFRLCRGSSTQSVTRHYR